MTAFAAASFAPGRPIIEAAFDLASRIKAGFNYDPDSTEVWTTPAIEAFDARRGVCQDFAHIMIAGLKGLGLPAVLRQRLPAHRPAAGPAAPGRRRRHPRLDHPVVRRGGRMDRLRPDQRPGGGRGSHHPGDRPRLCRRGARSAAWCWGRATRRSRSGWTWPSPRGSRGRTRGRRRRRARRRRA